MSHPGRHATCGYSFRRPQVLAAEQDPRGDVGPRLERRWSPIRDSDCSRPASRPRTPAPAERPDRTVRSGSRSSPAPPRCISCSPSSRPGPRPERGSSGRPARAGSPPPGHRRAGREATERLGHHDQVGDRRSPATASRYSGSPAESSSHGRSGATTSCPARAARPQPDASTTRRRPAPWIRTNVAILEPPCAPQFRRRPRLCALPAGCSGCVARHCPGRSGASTPFHGAA